MTVRVALPSRGRLRDGVVTSRPIAGSRPRGRTEGADDLVLVEVVHGDLVSASAERGEALSR